MNIKHFIVSVLCAAVVLSACGLHADDLPSWLSDEVKAQVREAQDRKSKEKEAKEAEQRASEARQKDRDAESEIKSRYRQEGILPELTPTEAKAVAKPEVDLELYYKAAGFGFEDKKLSNLLTYGTHQLWTEGSELQRKFNAADEFDKPAVQKQIDKLGEQVAKKREEIKSKTFIQVFDDCTPYDVKMEGNRSSFTLNVSKGFIPIGSQFGQFSSPFPNVKAEIRDNERRSDLDQIADHYTGKVSPKWSSITVSGDTESIKALVRGMRDNPKKYSLELGFTELQGITNQRTGLDLSNPWGARRWTEFLVVAEIVRIKIVDKGEQE